MRPTRSKDIHASVPSPSNAAPTSFFLATEADSNFGVRSLQDFIAEKGCTHDQDISDENITSPRPRAIVEDSSNNSAFPSASHSLTSLSQASHGPTSSIPSSPKSTSTRSFRPSDEDLDQGGSHAVTSSEEDEDVEHHRDVQESALQLIMPSIRMPSRRPFTDRGKSIGHLKILIAGDSGNVARSQKSGANSDLIVGVGKTSLIRSMVQVCEDIVHVDPTSSITSSVTRTSPIRERTRHGKTFQNPIPQITEIWASTKAYPQWWIATDDSKGPRRRKSMGDTILERNICFVDTPGYSQGLSITEGIRSVVSYIEEQLARPFSATITDEGELLGMLSGNGGTQVDVVLYMIDQGRWFCLDICMI